VVVVGGGGGAVVVVGGAVVVVLVLVVLVVLVVLGTVATTARLVVSGESPPSLPLEHPARLPTTTSAPITSPLLRTSPPPLDAPSQLLWNWAPT
jgi:hypothetical protein